MYLIKKISLNIFILLIAWVFFCVASSVKFDDSLLFKLFIPLLGLLTLWKPLWGISFFIVLTPFFGGSKPEDAHTVKFYTIFSVVNFALLINYLKENTFNTAKSNLKISHPLIFVLIIYWLTALFSLISIVPNQIVLSIFEFHSSYTRQFLNLSEESQIYPYLAFFALSSTMIFGFFLANHAAITPKTFLLYGIFLGTMVLTIILGLLDYYNVINLNSIRPWYFLAAYGEKYRFLHLTSVFGNPGWYAQYLVLGAPSLLFILSLKLNPKIRISLLVFLMVLTEYTIILIYQRGGWISYPITLIIIWFCVYIFGEERGHFVLKLKAQKKALLKIILSIPITITIALSTVYFVSKINPAERQRIEGFLERAESIKNTGDRLMFFQPSFEIAKKHPIFGPGLDSFAFESKKLYENFKDNLDSGKITGKTYEPIWGTAHNMYFQAMSGKGFVGLASLLALIFTALVLVWDGVTRNNKRTIKLALTNTQQLSLMMTLGFICAFAIYGNVGEIFYSPSGHIVFALFLFITIGMVPTNLSISRRFAVSTLFLLLIAFGFHVWIEIY